MGCIGKYPIFSRTIEFGGRLDMEYWPYYNFRLFCLLRFGLCDFYVKIFTRSRNGLWWSRVSLSRWNLGWIIFSVIVYYARWGRRGAVCVWSRKLSFLVFHANRVKSGKKGNSDFWVGTSWSKKYPISRSNNFSAHTNSYLVIWPSQNLWRFSFLVQKRMELFPFKKS